MAGLVVKRPVTPFKHRKIHLMMKERKQLDTVDINKETSQFIFAIHLEAAGIEGVIATLPKHGDILFKRRPREPWQETLDSVEQVLRTEYGIMLAGRPYLRERRPQLLLAMHLEDVLAAGLESNIRTIYRGL